MHNSQQYGSQIPLLQLVVDIVFVRMTYELVICIYIMHSAGGLDLVLLQRVCILQYSYQRVPTSRVICILYAYCLDTIPLCFLAWNNAFYHSRVHVPPPTFQLLLQSMDTTSRVRLVVDTQHDSASALRSNPFFFATHTYYMRSIHNILCILLVLVICLLHTNIIFDDMPYACYELVLQQ